MIQSDRWKRQLRQTHQHQLVQHIRHPRHRLLRLPQWGPKPLLHRYRRWLYRQTHHYHPNHRWSYWNLLHRHQLSSRY